MFFIVVTAVLVAAMALNHAVHGFGCWGLQPGGPASALIYDSQILAGVTAVLWLMISLAQKTVPYDRLRLRVITGFVFASVATFMLFGWTAHTSIHHLGAENLFAFLTVAATTYLIGRYMRWNPDDNDAVTPDDAHIDFAGDREIADSSDNPYHPPRTLRDDVA